MEENEDKITEMESVIATLTKEKEELTKQLTESQADIAKFQAYIAKYACSKEDGNGPEPPAHTRTLETAYAEQLAKMRKESE